MPTVIDAKTFINLFSSKGVIVPISDLEVTDIVNLTDLNYFCKGAKIINVKFLKGIHFGNCDLGHGLVFENCTFEEHMTFVGCTANLYNASFNIDGHNISLINCVIKNHLSFTQLCNFERGIVIKKNCEIDSLVIHHLAISNHGIEISDSSIKTKFEFHQLNILGSLSLNRCKIGAKLEIDSCRISSIAFQKLEVAKRVQISGGQVAGGISISEGEYSDDVVIVALNSSNGGELLGNLTLKDARFKKTFDLNYSDSNGHLGGFKKIFIFSNVFSNGLFIQGSTSITKTVTLEELHLDNLNSLEGQVEINHFNIITANISGTQFKAGIVINNSRIQYLNFIQFYNYGGFQLNNVTSIREAPDSKIQFINSHFEKTQFVNVHLDSFKTLYFNNSNISQISFVDTKWFDKSQIDKGFVQPKKNYFSRIGRWFTLAFSNVAPTDSELNYYRQLREIYRQLKLATFKQSDIFQSLIFKSDEMAAYKMELKLSKIIFNKDRFVMWLNQSNQYGQNWLRPIGLAMLVNFIFFFCIVVAQSHNIYASVSFQIPDIKATAKELYDYLYLYWQMLNPTLLIHRAFKLLPDGKQPEINNAVYFWLILSKISISYFIFQTISAFRKFNK